MGMDYQLGLCETVLGDAPSARKFEWIAQFVDRVGLSGLNEVTDEEVFLFVWDLPGPEGRSSVRPVPNRVYFDESGPADLILREYRRCRGGGPYVFFPNSGATLFVPGTRAFEQTVTLPGSPLDGQIYSGLDHLRAQVGENLELAQGAEFEDRWLCGFNREDYVQFLTQLATCCDRANAFEMCLVAS